MRRIPLLLGFCLLCAFLIHCNLQTSAAPVAGDPSGPTTAPSSQPATQPTTMPEGETSWLSGLFGPRRPKPVPPGKLFFTDDDGKTWFIDDATKIPPYTDANGKEAVQVYVYKCGRTGKPFVGYMLKYSPEGQKRMLAAMNQPNGHMMDIPPTVFSDVMVKKPGDANWVSRSGDAQAFVGATTPICPDGGTEIYPVNPNPL